MRKVILLLILFKINTAHAKGPALGISFGSPTGLSLKYGLSKANTIQGDLSGNYSSLDYMWIDGRNFKVPGLKWLYGAGAIIKHGVGLRGITSVEYDIKDYPFHAFANLSFAIINDSKPKTHVGAAVGARYQF
jgi:hypothetical protein